jgi:hypothetical protein
MSVLVHVVMEGDTDVFRASLEDRASDYQKIAAEAREAGAIHHRFGIGDGFILIEDEWLSAKAFRDFFSRTELQDFIGEVGGNMTSEPAVIVAEPVSSPDQF